MTAAPDVIWQRCPMLFDSMMVKAQNEGVGKQWVAEMIPADSGFRVDWAMTAVPSGTCSGPMLWDVFGTHVVGRVRGQFSSITCANFQ